MLVQKAHDSATHAVITARKENEAGLVGGVLPAVAKDQQPFFIVMIWAVSVGFIECFEQTLCHHLQGG
jgi:hypothetical protein